MKTKIIAEIGYNHNGDFNIAKELIDQAKDLKLWAVKLQKWDVENIDNEKKIKIRNDKNSYGETYYDHRKFLEFSIGQILDLKQYAENQGLEFICSGKDFNSIKLLDNNGIVNIKIPSQFFTDREIFNYLIDKGRNIFCSSGMHTQEEIYMSQWIGKADVIMHCINCYPTNLNDCDLDFMRKNKFYNGYSSHEFEGRAIKYAVVSGAEYIERHFTFDKSAKGTDHFVSSDFDEMKRIITEIKEAEMILGSGRQLNDNEIRNMKFYRGLK